jgi:hypothetical protein
MNSHSWDSRNFGGAWLCVQTADCNESKLYSLSRAFQRYVAHHLQAKKSCWFPTFSGRELNYQFDSQPFFWPQFVFWMSKWVMRTHFRNLCFNSFPMIWKTFITNGFWPLQLPIEIQESIGTSTPKMGVHLGVWRFIRSHSLHSWEHVMWLLGLPVGSQPCKPLPWSQAQS